MENTKEAYVRLGQFLNKIAEDVPEGREMLECLEVIKKGLVGQIDISRDFGSLTELGWEAVFNGPDVYIFKKDNRYVEIDGEYVDIRTWNGKHEPGWLTTLELRTLCKFCCANNLIQSKTEQTQEEYEKAKARDERITGKIER